MCSPSAAHPLEGYASAASVPPPPRHLGKYEILERIGAGGMSEVHRARCYDANGRPKIVAVKQLCEELSRDPAVVSMFLDEARLAAQLAHPSIVQLEEFGADESGRAFMVLELIDGRDLRWCLAMAAHARFWLPVEFSLSVLRQLCHALEYAHEARAADGQPLSIVHRDVSHSNIFLSRRGEVKLADFGIARARGRQSVTRTGMVKGKLGYLSPEQVRAEPLDRRTDIFAASVVLWELLTQRRMFIGASEFKTMLAVCTGERTAPSTFRPGLPREIDALVLRGVAIAREDRYATAGELGAAIDALADEVGLELGAPIIAEVIRYLSEIEALHPKPPQPDNPSCTSQSFVERSPTELLEPFATRTPTAAGPHTTPAPEIEPSDVFASRIEQENTQESELSQSGEHSAIDLVHPATTTSSPSGGVPLTPYVRRVGAAVSAFGDQPIHLRRGGSIARLGSFAELLSAIRFEARTPNDAISMDGVSWSSLERFIQLAELDPGPALREPASAAAWTSSNGVEVVGLIGDLALRGFTGRVLIGSGEERRACLFDRGSLIGVASAEPGEQLLTALVAEARPGEPRLVQRILGELVKNGVSLEQAAPAVLGLTREAVAQVRLGLAIETLATVVRLEDKHTAREPTGGWPRGHAGAGQLELLLPATAQAWTGEALDTALQPLRGAGLIIMAGLPPLAQLLRVRESARPILEVMQPGRKVGELLSRFPVGSEAQRLAQRLLLIFIATGAIRLR